MMELLYFIESAEFKLDVYKDDIDPAAALTFKSRGLAITFMSVKTLERFCVISLYEVFSWKRSRTGDPHTVTFAIATEVVDLHITMTQQQAAELKRLVSTVRLELFRGGHVIH